MDAKKVDARYRDLQKVARNFRTVKTTFLEIRPIFLRKLLYNMDDLEAMEFLLDKIKATKNNAEFFDSMRR